MGTLVFKLKNKFRFFFSESRFGLDFAIKVGFSGRQGGFFFSRIYFFHELQGIVERYLKHLKITAFFQPPKL